MRFAHIINPVNLPEEHSSYLYYAQPITFQSMLIAKNDNVDILCRNYPEDDCIIPNKFKKLPHLERSVQSDHGDNFRKLPYIKDILDFDKSNYDYIIYTNTDISVKPDFYNEISKLVIKHDAFIINRRDGVSKIVNNKRLGPNDLNTLYKFPGKIHEGYDCFVFSTKIKIDIGDVFVGYPHSDGVLMLELYKNSKNFKIFKDLHLTFHLGEDKGWKVFGQKDTDSYRKNLAHMKVLFDNIKYDMITLRLCRHLINKDHDRKTVLNILNNGEISSNIKRLYIGYKKWDIQIKEKFKLLDI